MNFKENDLKNLFGESESLSQHEELQQCKTACISVLGEVLRAVAVANSQSQKGTSTSDEIPAAPISITSNNSDPTSNQVNLEDGESILKYLKASRQYRY